MAAASSVALPRREWPTTADDHLDATNRGFHYPPAAVAPFRHSIIVSRIV
jgi:hypothetical protein